MATPPSASAMRLNAAEARLAELQAMLAAANTPRAPQSSSVIRARVAENQVAALEAQLAAMEPPPPKSASVLRVEKAEARLAELQAVLDGMSNDGPGKRDEVVSAQVTPLPAHEKPPTPPRAKTPKPPRAKVYGTDSEKPNVVLDAKGKHVCFSFLKNGKCKKGDACTYSHEAPAGNKRVTFADKGQKGACVFNSKPGGCRKGDACEFAHEDGDTKGKPPRGKAVKAKGKSDSVTRAEAAEARVAALEAALKDAQSPSPDQRGKGICKFFKTGSCKNGDACEFEHVEELEPRNRQISAAKSKEDALQQFESLQQEMKLNVEKVEEEMKAKFAKANTLDLVIVMDCTGSMDAWIEAAKSSILTIIDNVKLDHPRAKVRVGFVAYRDFCDGANRLQSFFLTEAIDLVRSFITTCRAFGGGDEPEDLAGALQQVLEMDFEAEGKRVIVVTDAPCHGNKFHDTRDDQSYAADIKNSPDICGQMKTLARRGIDFTIIEVKPERTTKMVDVLESEYKTTRPAKGIEPEFLKVKLKDSGDVVRFENIVRSSASSSLMASKARTVAASSKTALGVSTMHHYGPTGQKGTTLSDIVEGESEEEEEPAVINAPDKKPLDWDEVLNAPEIPAVRHSFHFRPNEAIDWASPNLKHTTQQTTIRVLPTCFAKGAMRSAHAMYDCKIEKFSVAKFYFGAAAATLSPSSTSSFSLEDDVEMQIVAKQLATEFSLDPRADEAVDFIFTCWYEITHPAAAGLDVSMTKFTVEPYIEGEYEKYNNNNGWICSSGLPLADTAQAFSHFTYQTTFGQHMVVDIQGVGSVFTDPQIHSLEANKFGHGNLSKAGMLAFFSTHECNNVCRALDLTPMRNTMKPVDEAPTKKSGVSGDKSMVCSCPLCGAILAALRSEFVREHGKGREIYCAECTIKVNKREPRACNICKKDTAFSPYWYDMKGMEHPTTCKKCKAAARSSRS